MIIFHRVMDYKSIKSTFGIRNVIFRNDLKPILASFKEFHIFSLSATLTQIDTSVGGRGENRKMLT